MNTTNTDPQGWRGQAACIGYHTIMDLNEDNRKQQRDHIKLALSMCATCPVQTACHRDTLLNPPLHHCVQGGLIWTHREIRARLAYLDHHPQPPCGTTQGYQQHITRRETTCISCRVAEATFRRGKRHRPTTTDVALF